MGFPKTHSADVKRESDLGEVSVAPPGKSGCHEFDPNFSITGDITAGEVDLVSVPASSTSFLECHQGWQATQEDAS